MGHVLVFMGYVVCIQGNSENAQNTLSIEVLKKPESANLVWPVMVKQIHNST